MKKTLRNVFAAASFHFGASYPVLLLGGVGGAVACALSVAFHFPGF